MNTLCSGAQQHILFVNDERADRSLGDKIRNEKEFAYNLNVRHDWVSENETHVQ